MERCQIGDHRHRPSTTSHPILVVHLRIANPDMIEPSLYINNIYNKSINLNMILRPLLKPSIVGFCTRTGNKIIVNKPRNSSNIHLNTRNSNNIHLNTHNSNDIHLTTRDRTQILFVTFRTATSPREGV
ncbi:hypothetical protein BC827DRAFT_1196453 [Russula dissimulans]|nr:hypothetical protein BC827DRAFT_1196453 [Russula dissimulans]